MDPILEDGTTVATPELPEAAQPKTIICRTNTVLSRFNEDFSETLEVSPVDTRNAYPLRIIQGLRVERSREKSYESRQSQALSEIPRGIPNSPTFAEKLAEARTRRMSTATTLAYERRRSVARTIVEKHREAKTARRQQEKVNKKKSRMSGTIWGYDPTTGQISNPMPFLSSFRGSYVFRGLGNSSDEYGIEEVDGLGRRTGRQWLDGSK